MGFFSDINKKLNPIRRAEKAFKNPPGVSDRVHEEFLKINKLMAHESLDGGGILRGTAIATAFGKKSSEFLKKAMESDDISRKPSGGSSRPSPNVENGGGSNLDDGDMADTSLTKDAQNNFTPIEFESSEGTTVELDRGGLDSILTSRSRWKKT